MIKILSNEKDFEYDVYSLVKAFYPKEEIVFQVDEDLQEKINHFYITIRYEKNEITIALFKEYLWCIGENKIVLDSTDRKNKKNQLKKMLYLMLREYSGIQLPWGTLTGIRPTKIPMACLEQGMKEEELYSYMKDTYLASDEKIDLSIEIVKREREILRKIDYENGFSLYIGIPFCPSTCLYCSFASNPIGLWKKRLDEYLDALEKEIDFVAKHTKNKIINTVYIGGGTPTSLEPEHLQRLIDKVESSFDLSHMVEFTVEAGRPDSITREKLQVLKNHKVTRISINPQTMKDETLKILGRNHTVAQVKESFALARELGFDNINADLILGLPGENLQDVEHTMKEILELKPESLTIHSLALKRSSRLNIHEEEYRNYTMNNSKDHMEMTEKYARNMGLVPYYLYRQKNMAGNMENVGYAKSGQEGVYNILIMEEKQTIIALGAGVSSKFVKDHGEVVERVETVKDVDNYLSRIDEMIERKRKKMEEFQWL